MAERRKRSLASSKHSSGHEQEESTDLNLSRRPPETILPLKRIKSDGQNDENENRVTSQDSGYSGSQGNAFQAMDLDGDKNFSNSEESESQGQNVEPMDIDEHRKQSGPSGDTTEKEDNYLWNINVYEDSQEPHEEESRKTGDENRSFAENVVCCSVSIGPSAASQQKKKKKQAKKQREINEVSEDPQELVLKNACALLNTGGGVLVIKIVDFQSITKDSVDNFWKTIAPRLSALITSSLTYDEVFDRLEFSDEVLLFIRAPQHFCTLKYNLFLPSDERAYEASYEQTLKLLEKQPSKWGKKKKFNPIGVPLNDLPTVPKVFKYNESLNFHESKQVQFKHWTSETYLDHNNHGQRQSIERWISAFANGRGGVILLGVTDEGRVAGQELNPENSQKDIEERVSSLFNNMVCDFTMERKTHWDMEFVPVVQSDCDSNAVIVIYVAGLASCGGVFTNCPKSFQLKVGEDGNKVPFQLDFKGWKERMLSAMGLQSSGKAMDAMVAKFDRLRVSKGHLLTVKDDAQKIRDAFFHVREDFPVMPEGFELSLPENVKTIIKEIQKKASGSRSRGLLVAARSWLANVGGTPLDGVICDLVLVSRNLRGLHLLTLCDSADDGKFLIYSREVAQKIKVGLAIDGACCQKVYVVPHVVPCTDDTTQAMQALNIRDNTHYPKSYDLTSRQVLNEVLKSLVIILATVPSTLSSKLGVSIMNLLTKEQFQLVKEQIEVNRELWIKGPAGTGKTLVAVEFMRELMLREKLEKNQILCVCENAGIREQIRDCEVCKVVCRQLFEKLEFPEVRHIIMDEAHNYEISQEKREALREVKNTVVDEAQNHEVYQEDQKAPKDVLYQKARRLVRQHDPNRPGYLWVFADRGQTNHKFPSGMPDETMQKPSFRLKKVIRYSKEIFDHAKKFLTKDNLDENLEMGHDYNGEKVQLIRYQPRTGKTQVDAVNETIQALLNEGYRRSDVAVLFRKGNVIPKIGLHFKAVDAEYNKTNDVVVSTVLKYSGLERPVVVLVDVEDIIPPGRMRDPFIYCAVTRAMVKLVIIRCKN